MIRVANIVEIITPVNFVPKSTLKYIYLLIAVLAIIGSSDPGISFGLQLLPSEILLAIQVAIYGG